MPHSSTPGFAPSTTLTHGRAFRVIQSQESKIRELVLRAAQATQPIVRDVERRSHQRVPYMRLIPLLPLENPDFVPDSPPIHVVGKHLAPLGLDFFHDEPIPQRYAVVSLETTTGPNLLLMMKITWCRFLKAGWYDSGGRFVKAIEWQRES